MSAQSVGALDCGTGRRWHPDRVWPKQWNDQPAGEEGLPTLLRGRGSGEGCGRAASATTNEEAAAASSAVAAAQDTESDELVENDSDEPVQVCTLCDADLLELVRQLRIEAEKAKSPEEQKTRVPRTPAATTVETAAVSAAERSAASQGHLSRGALREGQGSSFTTHAARG
ncbi:unnamed protein product [Symbiodinium natans]|uniref:Uncharacterized protein n=1 Tax=Symbiodinium natans TaxID=878477 RepID=A0A812MDX2_9DINO|nr:unnamed protein product [Symbiodinium natans]